MNRFLLLAISSVAILLFISSQQGALAQQDETYDPEARLVELGITLPSDPSFVEQPAVINGFSDLIVQVFGERGRHARAAVGMASLPRGQAVEIEMIVEVRD